jgi:hypothetical protein
MKPTLIALFCLLLLGCGEPKERPQGHRQPLPKEEKIVGVYEQIFPATRFAKKMVSRRVINEGGVFEKWTDGKKSPSKASWRVENGEILVSYQSGITVIYKILPNDEIARIGEIVNEQRWVDPSGPSKPFKRIKE